jgi:hypothetical protein
VTERGKMWMAFFGSWLFVLALLYAEAWLISRYAMRPERAPVLAVDRSRSTPDALTPTLARTPPEDTTPHA